MNYWLNFSQMMGLCLQRMMKELDEYLVMMRPAGAWRPFGPRPTFFRCLCAIYESIYAVGNCGRIGAA